MESIPAEVLGTITGTPVQKNAAQSDSCAVNLGSQSLQTAFFFFFLRTEEKQHLPCYTIWKKTKINFKQRLVPTEMQPKNCEITKRLSFCGILYLFRKILCKINAFFPCKWQYICVTVYFFFTCSCFVTSFPWPFPGECFFLLSQLTLTWLTQP